MLPPEIFGNIIHSLAGIIPRRHLASDSYTLVSRQFRDICQALVFRSIWLEASKPDRIVKLAQILSSNRRIALAIREAIFVFADPSDPDIDVWITILELLHTGPHGGSSLLELELEFPENNPIPTWGSLPAKFRIALQGVVVSQTLNAISISNISCPIHVLPFIPNLKSLRTTSSDGAQSLPSSEDDMALSPYGSTVYGTESRLRLDYLIMDTEYALELARAKTSSGQTTVDWGFVKNILFHVPDNVATETEGVLEVLSRVRELKILCFSAIQTKSPRLFSTMQQSAFGNLVSLEWHTHAKSDQDDPFMGFFEAVSSFPSDNALERFTLEPFLIVKSNSTPHWDIREREWTKTIDVLTNLAFPSLKELVIYSEIIDMDENGYFCRRLADHILEQISYAPLERRFPKFSFEVTYE